MCFTIDSLARVKHSSRTDGAYVFCSSKSYLNLRHGFTSRFVLLVSYSNCGLERQYSRTCSGQKSLEGGCSILVKVAGDIGELRQRGCHCDYIMLISKMYDSLIG